MLPLPSACCVHVPNIEAILDISNLTLFVSDAVAWLEERIESEYKQQPGFQEGQSSLFTLDPGAPEDLPDNLRGERWGFVQLPLADLQGELALLQRVLASIAHLA